MEEDEQLIDIVKTYPCLYDTKSADFKVNLKKENAWKAISNALARPGELTLSRATALFGTTRDLIEWARALFGTISIWPTLSSHPSRSLRLSLKPIYNRHRLVLFYLCTKL